MLVPCRCLLLSWILFLFGFVTLSFAGSPNFDRDIRPVLSNHCFACHGPDASQRQADLRLDQRETLVAGGVLNEQNLSESEVLARISSSDPDFMMPPPDFGKPLQTLQIEKLREWILQGAPYDIHWSFAPLRRPIVPAIPNSIEVVNPIDAFIIAKLVESERKPSPAAGPAQICRRLYLDLLGIPPTWNEVQIFSRDFAHRGSAAISELIERLFKSPRHGERMAAHWLDLVRYADTVGFHGDQNQNVYPYRDYVIDSFQNNKPFDDFTIEQIAGDLIKGATPEQRIASGLNRLNMMTREGGAQPREYIAKYQADRVRTIGMAWLGLTAGCAECHDHKYDPFTTKDFYSLSAYFADLQQWGVYADYGYTPNADLKGYDNDSPFPPELEVQNRGLLKRQQRIYQQLLDLAKAHVERAPENLANFSRWNQSMYHWLAQNPSGWQALPRVPNDSNGPDEIHSSDAKDAASWKQKFLAAELPIAAIRIDLPFQEKAFQATSLQFEFLLMESAGTSQPVEVRRADATEQKFRYQGGSRILDVRHSWILPELIHGRELAGVWQFARPIVFRPGQYLLVRANGAAPDSLGLQIRWSPVPYLRPFDPSFVEKFTDYPNESGRRSDIMMAYCFARCDDEAARAQFHRLEDQYRECRDGWTWTQVSASTTPREVRVLSRGNWLDESGEVVLPSLPPFLTVGGAAGATEERQSRLDLARWLVSSDNPLTARAVVNRLWAQFFGTGLCATLDDLGAQGESPSHPELLDWLAVELQESGWDLRHVIRLLVTSRTYQQDSRVRTDLAAIDPLNRLLGLHPPRRLEAEAVRDNILSISGLLRLDAGGPTCKPPQPPGYYANLQFPDRDYHADEDGSQYRRGVYMHWQRTFLHPMLAAFDAPSREDCIAMRNRSNTPQQALVLLNDPTFSESARAFAERMLLATGSDVGRIQYAFRTALARDPTPFEMTQLREFLSRQRQHYATFPNEAKEVQPANTADLGRRVLATNPSEFAAWFAVARVVLNLHEVITRY